MNAIELLKQDHQTVRQLLEKLAATTERAVKTRGELVAKLQTELSLHTDIEETIFYPALQKAGGKEEAVMSAEAREEHRAVEDLVLPDLLKTDPASVNFAGRAKVLKELLEHHIEEEESDMFDKATELLGKQQLDELGKQMAERRRNLSRQAA